MIVMLATSHIAVTTLILIGTKSAGIELNVPIVIVSYALGVGVDIDHIVFYGKDSLDRIIEYKKDRHHFKLGEKNLHSYLQEPVALFAVILLSLATYVVTKNIAVFIPAICFAAHIVMDMLMDFDSHILWPISKKAYRGPYKQNVFIEAIIGTLLSVFLILIFLGS